MARRPGVALEEAGRSIAGLTPGGYSFRKGRRCRAAPVSYGFLNLFIQNGLRLHVRHLVSTMHFWYDRQVMAARDSAHRRIVGDRMAALAGGALGSLLS